MKSIYIAGPMRGIHLYNFPAFDAAKKFFESQGLRVVNPADIDRQKGNNPEDLPDDHDWDTFPDMLDFKQTILTDVQQIINCDSIYLLSGWENSKGAAAEKAVAQWAGKEIIYDVKDYQEDILVEALRITGGDRQADYGPPNQDFERTAGMWSAYLMHKLKEGENLRDFDVACMMIHLKTSRQQHQRKRDNWVDIAGYARCGQICDEACNK